VYGTPEPFDNTIPGMDAGSLYAEALRKAQAGRPLSPVEATALDAGPPASKMAPPSRLPGMNMDMPTAPDNTIKGMETGSLYKDAMDKIKAEGEAKKKEPMSGQAKALTYLSAPFAAAADVVASPVNVIRNAVRNPLDRSERPSMTPFSDARTMALAEDFGGKALREMRDTTAAAPTAEKGPQGFEAQIAKQIADLESQTGRKLSEGAKDALRQQEMAKMLKGSKGVQSTANMATPDNIKSDKSGLPSAAAARGAGSAGGAGTGGRGAANAGLGAAAGRGYAFDMPKAQTTEERLAEIDEIKKRMGAKNEEYLRPMQEQLDKYATDAKAEKTQGKYEALLQAGLGMLGGKSQYAMQNIGEGGSMGLAALRESNKLSRAAQDKLLAAQNDMAKSRIALEKGDETAALTFANQGRQEMKDRATLQLQAQYYAGSNAAQMAQANAAMARVNALGGTNDDKHMLALTRVRSALSQDPEYKELAKMAAFKGTLGDNARTRMADMEKKLYGQLAPELLSGLGGNTMGAGGPQLAQADLALINKYTSPR
jgi:hypothetical protein